MTMGGWTRRLRDLSQDESLRPDISRAVRGTTAIVLPLVLGRLGHLPVEGAYAVLAALNVSTVDVRGGYSLRFALLLAMTAILAACAGLGGLVGENMPWAVAAMGLVALCGALWRHMSPDYGPGLAISSTLVFAIGLNVPGASEHAGRHLLATLAGGLLGLGLQVALWPFRPQHPLRRTVSESWLALSGLFEAMSVDEPLDSAARDRSILAAESAMRTVLDETASALAAARTSRTGHLVRHLEDLNRAAFELSADAGALSTVLDSLMDRSDFEQIRPSFQPVLTALRNTSRTVALAVISRQPSDLLTLDVRVRRLTGLLGVLGERTVTRTARSVESTRLLEIVRRISADLHRMEAALRVTIERADERLAFPVELFDLETWRLQPLAAAVNLGPRLDPALVRHGLRSAVLTMAAVLALFVLHVRHGYWLPFTIMIVLQPDYGSTRQKAAQRLLGTLGGSVVASAVLLLHLPVAAILAATAATSFAFLYFLKRNYGIAVVFITVFIVFLTENSSSVGLSFALERLACTTAGGLMALAAALLFWPVWERERFPAILARAFAANRGYLQVLMRRIVDGGAWDDEARRAQRRAERAGGAAFSSLRRMGGDPGNDREMIERSAALANGNQRLIRAFNSIALHLEPGAPPARADVLLEFERRASGALEALAVSTESGGHTRGELDALREGLDRLDPVLPAGAGDEKQRRRLAWIVSQLGRASTELSAMLIA